MAPLPQVFCDGWELHQRVSAEFNIALHAHVRAVFNFASKKFESAINEYK
jgi:hypothetical protein